MKDLTELRNIFISNRYIKKHRQDSFQITPQNKEVLNNWIANHKDLWDSYLSDFECVDELFFYINHPLLKKEDFVCKRCKKILSFQKVLKHNHYCCKECMNNVIPSDKISKQDIHKIFQKYSKSGVGVDRVIQYLGIKGKKISPYFVYDKTVIDVIQAFYNEHPNQKDFFTRQTNIEKYGGISPFSDKRVQEKSKETKRNRYNNENYNNRDKYRQTCMDIYGVDNTFKSELIKDKSRKTMKDRYGVEFTTQSSELQEKIKKTNRERFGVDYMFNRKEVQEKGKQTMKEKYGFESPFARMAYLKQHNCTIENEITTQDLMNRYGVYQQTITSLTHELNVPYRIFYDKFIYSKDVIAIFDNYFNRDRYHSRAETEICEFIKSICNFTVLINDRNILSGNELDLYVVEKSVAIEFDGIYWHNDLNKPKNYHLEKTVSCEKKNIRLIHIYESDWRDKKDICKSIIASALGVYKNKYFARKLDIGVIDKNEAREFYNINHIQGFEGYADVNLALFYNNKIIQCCSFKIKGFHSGETELIRMATLLNCQVVGGFSKLVSYFVKNYQFNNLISYINRSLFDGKGYLNSGFEIVHYNPPSYYVVYHETLYHKSKFRKACLKKMFDSGEIKFFDETKTEEEIEHINHIYRLYDCGTIKVEYRRKNNE